MSDQVPVQDQDVPQEVGQTFLGSQTTNGSESTVSSSTSPFQIHADEERLKEMEREADRLRELHSQLDEQQKGGDGIPQTDEEKRDIDSRSVYIGNVDYGSTPLELQQHFSSAGIVKRVTILTNKFTGQPKGFAYLEFDDVDGVNKAVATLDGTVFRDRELKVSAKRTNIPGLSFIERGRGGFRGRGGRGGGFRGGRGGRGRGGFRGRGGGGQRFTPY
ncbi:predicted protein [Scheffersomyces stipitis CBS 6054]|uniref:RRM domain-containing protein n=1 Tax=Scheffersomyces stipitis (strain ATCC 58785 / CBS 6054 / NBRC 10063 / NRRL Y-11545) TaxID=322104 RepID=A3M0M8_PICST|nr:predicted protein [Scheffersomyces stipitis CBS 6054]ABN68731.1 predicted protein [Scheffersomyces stipitis CBS 6054]